MKLYSKIRGLSLLLLWIILSAGCKSNVPEAMQFQVNPDLLGARQRDTLLEVTYASPIGFMTSTNEQAIRQGAMSQADEGVEIRAVYQNDASQAFMVISAITEERWEQLSSSSGQEAFSSAVWTNMNAAAYGYKNFDVRQWLLQNQEWINFKLIFKTEKDRFFQLDYLLPSSEYNEQTAKAVESSIGSFNSF
ncbi:hypothetical protein [Catalinimonas niigatensis]|uniref:hypothetical protein n=1 Tax=Catalinimonas niigatensis TaxID=1397264 RepID=UPI00266670CF|nr:hypothetical protein [Catalinimonas niigatensis]WPP48864.1 hypothetical protein PZB72_19535 [Catalinimonas niigatensis]